MHELSIIEGIIKISQEEAKKNNVKRIIEIRIKVGEMSGVIPDIMQEYFDIASRGTLVQGHSLKLKRCQLKLNAKTAIAKT